MQALPHRGRLGIMKLPDELLLEIFRIVFEPCIRSRLVPSSYDAHYPLVILREHAEVDEKKKYRESVVSCVGVCRRWRQILWKELFKFIALPYSPTEHMLAVLERLRRIDFGVRNGDFVKDLYLAPGSIDRLQYIVTLLICWSCRNVRNLTISMFLHSTR